MIMMKCLSSITTKRTLSKYEGVHNLKTFLMRFKEDDLQKAVAKYLDLKGVLWNHCANERKTSPQAGKRLKLKGVKSGVPDCMIYNSKGFFKGLALELKILRYNGLKKDGTPRKPSKSALSDEQKKWLLDLSVNGWECRVAYTFEEAKNIIDEYLSLEK